MVHDSEDAFMLAPHARGAVDNFTRPFVAVELAEFDAFQRQMIEGLEFIADTLDNIIHALSDRA